MLDGCAVAVLVCRATVPTWTETSLLLPAFWWPTGSVSHVKNHVFLSGLFPQKCTRSSENVLGPSDDGSLRSPKSHFLNGWKVHLGYLFVNEALGIWTKNKLFQNSTGRVRQENDHSSVHQCEPVKKIKERTAWFWVPAGQLINKISEPACEQEPNPLSAGQEEYQVRNKMVL